MNEKTKGILIGAGAILLVLAFLWIINNSYVKGYNEGKLFTAKTQTIAIPVIYETNKTKFNYFTGKTETLNETKNVTQIQYLSLETFWVNKCQEEINKQTAKK